MNKQDGSKRGWGEAVNAGPRRNVLSEALLGGNLLPSQPNYQTRRVPDVSTVRGNVGQCLYNAEMPPLQCRFNAEGVQGIRLTEGGSVAIWVPR